MRLGTGVLLTLVCMRAAAGYSVLTHQAIIDTAWKDSIEPLLLKRFPRASAEDLRKAHAYAYGGAIIQDAGYYPLGSTLFSDLVHYVRSGDFIERLVTDSRDLNEYAFALGALAHSASDQEGHSIATNRAVAILYPKLKARFGDSITYEQNPAAHLKVEFGFDVLQVARGNYAPDAYHDFIGFEVSKPLLERAFRHTYGLEFDALFVSTDLALGSYRRAVSSVIPRMTKVAWQSLGDRIRQVQPGITRQRFVYNLSRASYRKEWGTGYKEPGFGSRLLGWLLRVVPRVGPFRALEFKPPTPEAERMFIESFNTTLERYRELLRRAGSGNLEVPNLNLDTGKPVVPGEYRMADEAYATLTERLAKEDFAKADTALRAHLLRFFSESGGRLVGGMKPEQWERLQRELRKLKAVGAQ